MTSLLFCLLHDDVARSQPGSCANRACAQASEGANVKFSSPSSALLAVGRRHKKTADRKA
eukprot:CAMPEP_0194773392 /NCGR_PEP_ID=MMETSP0323_2-20130528/54729_1 /TAXON_ID=2866 ORGANISM="Crypthecodinium cohnii, Strain Seligo" /NCGR_SAMPLE_ID=MMETSP0323_2 /ASSEMBLY_ACC=CAM_ASM_000346 /LENGTH=59 /DNA_ID=CAMNT_0039708417 /DNA_START=11 /DNA_END=186 /DNA_ORIENTATION=-